MSTVTQLVIQGERGGEVTLRLREDGMVVYTVRDVNGIQTDESGFWAQRAEEGEESLRETAASVYETIHGYRGTNSDVWDLYQLMGRVG